MEEDGRTPFLPEALKHYRRYERFGKTWSGGVMNQPHLQLLEFEVIEGAVSEHKVLQYIQQKARDQEEAGR